MQNMMLKCIFTRVFVFNAATIATCHASWWNYRTHASIVYTFSTMFTTAFTQLLHWYLQSSQVLMLRPMYWTQSMWAERKRRKSRSALQFISTNPAPRPPAPLSIAFLQLPLTSPLRSTRFSARSAHMLWLGALQITRRWWR